MNYTVEFSAESGADLDRMYRFIARRGFPKNAKRFTDRLTAFCLELSSFPHRGTSRSDLRPGLRILGYKDQAKVVFALDLKKNTVIILRILGRGQSSEKAFKKHLHP